MTIVGQCHLMAKGWGLYENKINIIHDNNNTLICNLIKIKLFVRKMCLFVD